MEPVPRKTSRIWSLLRRISARMGGVGRPLAGRRWMPLYGILRYVGRRSGKAYATPIVALAVPGGFLIPLPFGDGTQWLKNLQAADQAGLRHAGRENTIDRPEVVDLATAGSELPRVIRFACKRIGIKQFVRVHQVSRV